MEGLLCYVHVVQGPSGQNHVLQEADQVLIL